MGGRAHMRQQNHLALLGEPHEARIDGRFLLEHVGPRRAMAPASMSLVSALRR